MNKTFNDPNTRYSDQGTPLAQAADALNAIGDVTETVDELAETVDELSEKVDLIPVPVAADDGKVLTATDDGAYELADVDALPAISAGDAGKVLTVNAGATAAEWAAASGGSAYAIGSTEDQSGVLTLDKTGLEIVTALLNNLNCYIVGHTGDTSAGVYLTMPIYHGQWDQTGAVFYAWSFVHNVDLSFSCAELSEYPHTAT